MKIEVGKRYINAEGKITEITRFDGGCIYYDLLNNKYEYNGRVSLLVECTQDLICEVVPEILESYKEGFYESWQDVLKAHIDWYEYENDQ